MALYVRSMIFSENRDPLFRITLYAARFASPFCCIRHVIWSKRSWPKNGSPSNTISGTP